MTKKYFLAIYLVILFTNIIIGQNSTNDSIFYLNQKPPGSTPKIFAPNLISLSNEYEFGSVFSIAADKFYYAVRLNEDWKAEIRYTELQDGKWTKPKKIELNDKYAYNDPLLSTDEKKLFFVSNRAIKGHEDLKDFDLWYIQKTNKGWSEPISMGEPINSEKDEFYISLSNTGTVYFASNVHTSEENKWDFDIYYSKLEDDDFQVPVNLGDSINTKYFECDAFVSPDETYIIFCSTRPGGYGQGDLYISFKNEENSWTEAKNMGDLINTETHEFCPFLSKDGKYFFYTSKEDIYWVDSKIINKIRERQK